MQKLFFENFRIFKDQINLELAPITVFTGKNSSGKSTIIKGLLLLSDFLNSEAQLTLNLNDTHAVKHRLNLWENVKNWFADTKTVRFGYTQNGFNFYFSFSADSSDSVGLLDEFVIESPEIDEALVLQRRSTTILDLKVSQRFLNYFIGVRNKINKEDNLGIELNALKKSLVEVRNRKATAGSQELIVLIGEEEAIQKQINKYSDLQKAHNQTRAERSLIYQPEINIEKDEDFVNYKLQTLIRSSLRSYMIENSKKGGNYEMESRRRLDMIAFRFSEAFNFHTNFAVYHLSPGRIQQARLYYIYEGNSEFHNLINWYGKNQLRAGEEHRFLIKWMQKLEIGDDLLVKTIEGEAATVKIKLIGHNNYVDLADLGYGAGQVLSILLSILKIQYDFNHLEYKLKHLRKHTILLVEEAESNLHPLLQSRLADMFYEAYRLFNIQFVLETHSEYLIRRWQVSVANEEVDTSDLLLYYVDQSVAENTILKITIEKDGSLSDRFGEGFFDEADNQAMDLFKVQNLKN